MSTTDQPPMQPPAEWMDHCSHLYALAQRLDRRPGMAAWVQVVIKVWGPDEWWDCYDAGMTPVQAVKWLRLQAVTVLN